MDQSPRRLILIVEDDVDLAATCVRLLRRSGYAVVAVGSRAAALAALDDAAPAVLVSDVRLPDGDGLDVVRAAAAKQPSIPAVVIAGRASEAGRVAARAAGAVAYLPKPFTSESFARHVERALGTTV